MAAIRGSTVVETSYLDKPHHRVRVGFIEDDVYMDTQTHGQHVGTQDTWAAAWGHEGTQDRWEYKHVRHERKRPRRGRKACYFADSVKSYFYR